MGTNISQIDNCWITISNDFSVKGIQSCVEKYVLVLIFFGTIPSLIGGCNESCKMFHKLSAQFILM